MDYNKKYSINPRIAELILKQKAKLGLESTDGITNVDAENIFRRWFNSEKVDVTKYTEVDKDKLLFNMYELNPNQISDEKLLKFANNVQSVFTESEAEKFIKKYTTRYYKPGFVSHQLRAYNGGLLYFLSQFSFVKMFNGFTMNINFIGDVVKLIPDVQCDELGNITDTDIDNKIFTIIKTIEKELKYIYYSKKDNVYIIATDNEDTLGLLKTLYDKIEFVQLPQFYFDWK